MPVNKYPTGENYQISACEKSTLTRQKPQKILTNFGLPANFREKVQEKSFIQFQKHGIQKSTLWVPGGVCFVLGVKLGLW